MPRRHRHGSALAPVLLLLCLQIPALSGGSEASSLAAVRRLMSDPAPTVRAAGLRRLAGREDRPAIALLFEGLDDPHPYVRRAAAGVLGALDPTGWREVARRVRSCRSGRAREALARTAALWASAAGRRMLEGLRRDRDAGVRAAAYRWLAVDPADEVADLLEEGLRDADGLVRATALDALAGRPEREPSLAALLRDADPRVRLCALESSVARVTPQRDRGAAVVAVTRGLDDAVWSVRLRAAELSGGLPDALLLSPLIRALEDERLRIRMAAHVALVSLTGIPFEPEPAPWRAWLEEDGRSFDPSRREWPDRPPAAGGGTVEAGRFLDVPIASRHVAFVLDASGSMARRMGDGRTRWQHVAEALGTSLHGLRDAAVNVYRFSDEVEAIFPRPLRLTATIRSRIARWLDETVPGGRTALFDGVAAALDEPEVDTIVLLSDGAPSAGTFFTKTDLVSEVARRNRWRRARIDVIDVGGDAVAKRWQGALGRLAKESGGRYVRRQARGPAQK